MEKKDDDDFVIIEDMSERKEWCGFGVDGRGEMTCTSTCSSSTT